MPVSPRQEGSGVIKLSILSGGDEIDGTYKVVSVTINKKINMIPFAKIILQDGDVSEGDFPISNKDDFKPGAEIEIKAGYDQDTEILFKGIVVKHGIKITNDNFSRLVIECRDKSVKMTVGRKNANFVNFKDNDVITSIIENYSDLSSDIKSTNTTYKELVQYYCTDWDFMLSRAEVNGMLVLVDKAKISVKPPDTDSVPELKVTYGNDLIEFQAEIDARTQLKGVKGIAWDPKIQDVVEQDGADVILNKQGDLATADLADVVAPESFRLQSAISLEKTGLKAWADSQMIKAGLSRIIGRMKFQGNSKAKHGGLIEVSGVGNRFNGNVFVSSVYHDISNGNWLTEVGFGLPPDWFAEKRDIEAPPASGFLPGAEGLQVGIVKKLDEDPEAENKIQVAVPVMQAETEGVWARLASFYGSSSFGAFFVPEIGDEVVLGYFNNDPCHPVIIGSLYSSKNAPPYGLTADNYTKAIVTKNKLKIEFDDENKVITIESPGKNRITISDEDKSILLEDQNNNKVELGSGGISMESPKDIKLTAKGKISIDATGEAGITSKGDVNIKGLNVNNAADVGFVAKGNATAELSASGQTTVKGAMVMIN
ncbi:MAG: type VI secretion system tip protein VgrG [Desulfosarcina sp.]|nr:type VI secretion system tip protein VgrG [Desulfobacterales bacterium]